MPKNARRDTGTTHSVAIGLTSNNDQIGFAKHSSLTPKCNREQPDAYNLSQTDPFSLEGQRESGANQSLSQASIPSLSVAGLINPASSNRSQHFQQVQQCHDQEIDLQHTSISPLYPLIHDDAIDQPPSNAQLLDTAAHATKLHIPTSNTSSTSMRLSEIG